MHTPKAVVFDLGKVLLDFDYSVASKNLAQHCSISAEEIGALINQSPLLHRYESGGMTTQEFFAEIQRLSSFCKPWDEFHPLFADIFTPIPSMMELHEQIRAAGVPTCIFSNTNEIAVRHIQEKYPFFSRFSAYVYSYEHRAMKPHPSIYQVVEQALHLTGRDLLYIDDRRENVEGGKARDWQVIHHIDPSVTIPAVRQLLQI